MGRFPIEIKTKFIAVILILPHKIMRTTYNMILYFGFNFDWKSTYCDEIIEHSFINNLAGLTKISHKNSFH